MTESAESSIGARLRFFRESKKMSQVQMAEALGGKMRGIQNNELGITLPNSKVLLGLHRLGLNVNWLLSGAGPMLLADLQGGTTHELVSTERLGLAIAAVDNVAASRGMVLSAAKRGKLAGLVYQYFMLDKAEQETAAYLTQLMELVSNN